MREQHVGMRVEMNHYIVCDGQVFGTNTSENVSCYIRMQIELYDESNILPEYMRKHFMVVLLNVNWNMV